MKTISLVLVLITTLSGVIMNLIAAESYLIADQDTGYILAAKDVETPRQIASLTKVATVMVILEWIAETGGDLGQRVPVTAEAMTVGANPLNLKDGDMLPLESGIYAAMMASDNTSASAMATALGRQMSSGVSGSDAVAVFVERMNLLAKRLGMDQTRFVNPHGLDGEEVQGVSTAADMARLAIHACKSAAFAKFCSGKEQTVFYFRAGKGVETRLINTNELVGSRGIDGMKTGTTRQSGPCLMVSAAKMIEVNGEKQNRRLVLVLLKSEDRFREAVLLLNQAWLDCERWLVNGGVIGTNDHLRNEVN